MAVWEYLILFATVILGGGLAFLLRRQKESWLGYALAFSGAYLLGIVFLMLFPLLFGQEDSHTGLWVLGGFVLQFLLEPLSRGVEHGHLHTIEYSRQQPWQVLLIMLGLCIHAFIEGLPLSIFPQLADDHLNRSGSSLFWGIVLHKLPAAFALATLLLQSRVRTPVVLAALLVFSLMSPLGSWIGARFLVLQTIYLPLLGLVAGSFLHIATTILFETDSNRKHHFNWYKAGFVLLGFAAAMLS